MAVCDWTRDRAWRRRPILPSEGRLASRPGASSSPRETQDASRTEPLAAPEKQVGCEPEPRPPGRRRGAAWSERSWSGRPTATGVEEAPARAPDRILLVSHDRLDHIGQRSRRLTWRIPTMITPVRVAALAGFGVLLLGGPTF